MLLIGGRWKEYMMDYNTYLANALGMGFLGASMGILLIPLMVWSFGWKGYALWKASKNDSKVWFTILLLVNTVGILDILYIFVFGKDSKKTLNAVKSSLKKSTRK
jgi:methionyl-tRNA synthetase